MSAVVTLVRLLYQYVVAAASVYPVYRTIFSNVNLRLTAVAGAIVPTKREVINAAPVLVKINR